MTGYRARFRALGSNAVVLTTRRDAMVPAVDAAMAVIDAVDASCSRFRPDSELVALNAAAGQRVAVSPTLIEALRVALRAAVLTGGRVDPTLGRTMQALGYDRDFDLVVPDGPTLHVHIPGPAPWRDIELDDRSGQVRIPPGVELDLGATAKALAVDRAVRSAVAATGAGVVVSIGGDVAVAGPPPPGGWPVLVTDDHADEVDPRGQTVAVAGGGVATSGTTVRRWRRGGVDLHHLVDSRTGRPVESPWRTVSVAASTCVDANIASTAAMILGGEAPGWLTERALPSRLVRADGRVELVAGWPAVPDPVTETFDVRPVAPVEPDFLVGEARGQ